MKGKNPFADVRVRQAVNIAINRQAIQRVVMRGQSVPAGSIVGPFVNGYKKEYDTIGPRRRRTRRRACSPRPAIRTASRCRCTARTTAISTTRRSARRRSACSARSASRSIWSRSRSRCTSRRCRTSSPTSICSAGACRPTTATTSSATSTTRAKAPAAAGTATRYSNPEADKLIQSLSAETDIAKRNATVTQIWDKLLADQVYVAIHHQMLAHAMKNDIDVPVRPDNIIFFKDVAFKKS